MAKVTITFEDTEDGQVRINADFDPPISDNSPTPAQGIACYAMKAAVSTGEESDNDD